MKYHIVNLTNKRHSEGEYKTAQEAKKSTNPNKGDTILLNYNYSERLDRYLSTAISDYRCVK